MRLADYCYPYFWIVISSYLLSVIFHYLKMYSSSDSKYGMSKTNKQIITLSQSLKTLTDEQKYTNK